MTWRVMIIYSDIEKRQVVEGAVRGWAEDIFCCASLQEAQEKLNQSGQNKIALIFCEDRLRDGSYRDLLVRLGRVAKKTRVIVMTPGTDPDAEHREAVKSGAFEALTAPCRLNDVRWMVIQAIQDETRRSM